MTGTAAQPLPAMPSWLRDGPAARILSVLDGDGETARAIGGAVRNWLIGLEPGDIDIATTAPPGEVVRRVVAGGLKAVPTGIEHGTVTVVAEGRGFEVTTLREDVETDGRRAVVRFGRDWRADAARRDFTVNAMSLTRDGRLSDPFGGREDLAHRRIRFIGDPHQRIREDYLRILRFFRFHAAYGAGEPDAAALAACIGERAGLAGLSRERIRAELVKLLVTAGAAPTLALLAETGLAGPILGGIALHGHVARLAAIENALSLAPDPTLRLAALGVLVREDAERLKRRLTLSNEEFRRLDGVGHGWREPDPAGGEPAARAMLFATGPRAYRDRALIAFARSGAPVDDAGWMDLVRLPERWSAPSLPVGGETFMRRGVSEGPALGAAVARFRRAWIAAGFPLDRQSVDRLVIEAMGGDD
ncbi:CCA tRNA nucleotidyltransferase [Phreatobacter sp.]|uniref:CCA tRNA nucleotidyltransferase n=1 Tax=Phreatobacter sp. TaxID=1966341 RepID=UPI003F7309E6